MILLSDGLHVIGPNKASLLCLNFYRTDRVICFLCVIITHLGIIGAGFLCYQTKTLLVGSNNTR